MNPTEFDTTLAAYKAEAEGLAVEETYLGGVQTGNADLEATCAWVPTVIPETPQYVLPGREHAGPLGSRTWETEA